MPISFLSALTRQVCCNLHDNNIAHIIIHIGTQMVNRLHSQVIKLTPTHVTIPGLSVGCQSRQTLPSFMVRNRHGSLRMPCYKPHLKFLFLDDLQNIITVI